MCVCIVVYIYIYVCMYIHLYIYDDDVCMLSLVWLLATPWTIACQTPLSMEIFQSRILDWVTISYSKGSLWPRDWTWVSCKSPMLQMNSLTDELQMNSDDTTVSPGLLYTHTHACIHTHIVTPFPGGTDGKESACNVGDLGSIPGLGGSPGGGHDNPLQCSCLETLHGQRSLAGYRPWGCRVGHDWAAKHSTAQGNSQLADKPGGLWTPATLSILLLVPLSIPWRWSEKVKGALSDLCPS